MGNISDSGCPSLRSRRFPQLSVIKKEDRISLGIPKGACRPGSGVCVGSRKLGDILWVATCDSDHEAVTRGARSALAIIDTYAVGRPAESRLKIQSDVRSQGPRLMCGSSYKVKVEQDLLRSRFFESPGCRVSDLGAIRRC